MEICISELTVLTENKALPVLSRMNSCSKRTSIHMQLVQRTPVLIWKATSYSRPGIQ